MPVFFFLFIVMPIAELAVLIQVGSVIGVLNTVGLVFLTAVIGAWLLRQQGLATLLRANERLNSGELPAKEVAEGLILAVGGAMLLTPGFITDTFGFLCLLPGSRHWLASQALKRMTVSGQNHGRSFFSAPEAVQGPSGKALLASSDHSIVMPTATSLKASTRIRPGLIGASSSGAV